jgi:hypothetical protein
MQGGRPKWKPWADAYRKFGGLPVAKLAITAEDTVIEACVKRAYQGMLKTRKPERSGKRPIAPRAECLCR